MENYCFYEMQALVLITLLHTCACKTPLPSKPRSVNLALETIVEFDNTENSADVQIIDKVRSFLDRVKGVIDKNKSYRRSLAGSKLKFTDFIRQSLGILRSYDDSDLEDAVSVMAEEIKKYHYKGCRFHELFQKSTMRRAMAVNLEKIKNAPAKALRENLNKILRQFENNSFDSIQQEVVNYVNSLYGDHHESRFKGALDKLKIYGTKSKRSNMNLVQVVREIVRSLFFDHYSRLDSETRRELKLKLETFWQDFVHPQKTGHQVWDFKPLNKKHETKGDAKGVISGNLEIVTPKQHKSKIKKNRSNKVKRHRHETTTDRSAYATLSPEDEPMLDDVTHKKKATKSSRHATHMRGSSYKNILRSEKKHKKRAREIIAEHEAEINVEKDTLNNVFSSALNHLLGRVIRTPETTMKPWKIHKSHGVAPVKDQEYDRNIESDRDHKINRGHKKHKKHAKSKLRNHKSLNKKADAVDPTDVESNEGLPIHEDINLVTNTFRKSNMNDTFLNVSARNPNDVTDATTSPAPDVLKRINDLERELKVVKEQMKVTVTDSYETPTQFEELDFWEGTTTVKRDTTTSKLTTKTTTTTKATTTAKPKKPSTVSTTTKFVTKFENNTSLPVFRPSSETNERKMLLKMTLKSTTDSSIVKEVESHRNLSDIVPLMGDKFEDPPFFNNSADVDYFNDIKEPDINITSIADVERYLNETRPIDGDDKTRNLRKEMLERLKGINPTNPEILNSTLETPTFLADVKSDPMIFLDVDDDDIN